MNNCNFILLNLQAQNKNLDDDSDAKA